MAVVHGSERRDGVHQKQGRVGGVVDGFAHLGDGAGDTGGGLVVDDGDGLDAVRRVPGQACLDARRVGAGAPVPLQELHLQAELAGHVAPQGREVAGFSHEHAISR